MKRIICAFLITTTLLSFTACSSNYINNTEAGEQISSASTAEKTENRVYVEAVAGKTFAELMDMGYSYGGYGRDADNSYHFTVIKREADAVITDTVNKLEGKTIKDLYNNNLAVACFSDIDEECIFTTTIGDVVFSFEIYGSLDIIKKYNKDNDYIEVEKINKLHNKPIKDVKFKEIMYTVNFDDSFDVTKFETGDDFVLDVSAEKLKDCVVEEVYYNNIPENFLN